MSTLKRKFGYELVSFGLTDVGDRTNNEDYFLANDRLGAYIVCDGMGGLEGGEFASFFASKEIMSVLAGQKKPILTHNSEYEHTLPEKDSSEPGAGSEESIIRYAVWQTNQRLHRIAKEKGGLTPGMGTTAVGLWFIKDKVWSLNVGDSRAYGFWDGHLFRLTRDDCWVEEQVLVGNIAQNEKSKHRNKITKAIGTKPSVEPQIGSYPMPYSGGRFLLASDGFYAHVATTASSDGAPSLSDLMLIADLKGACNAMMQAAIESGKRRQAKKELKKRDNITLLLVDAKLYGIEEGKSKKPESDNEFTI